MSKNLTKLLKKRYRIVLDVSHDTKTQFQAVAALEDKKMTDILHKFIKSYVNARKEKLARLAFKHKHKGERGER